MKRVNSLDSRAVLCQLVRSLPDANLLPSLQGGASEMGPNVEGLHHESAEERKRGVQDLREHGSRRLHRGDQGHQRIFKQFAT